jgi:hypothetical protein
VFVLDEPDRLGRLHPWQPPDAAVPLSPLPDEIEAGQVESVLPYLRSVRCHTVGSHAVPPAVAVAALSGAVPMHPSTAVASAAGA